MSYILMTLYYRRQTFLLQYTPTTLTQKCLAYSFSYKLFNNTPLKVVSLLEKYHIISSKCLCQAKNLYIDCETL